MPRGPSRSNSAWSSITKATPGPSRTPSTWTRAEKEPYTPESQTPENRSATQREKVEFGLGRVVGGKHAKDIDSNEDGRHSHHDHGPITEVDIDMPLTLTELVHVDDKEYIVLRFAKGDPENPFNWNPWYKRSVTTMLNLMTLFIGLATTAYSSGITKMTEEFGVSNIIGQLGLFLFNFVCAIAPLVLAPFCELVGRKVVYAGAYLCFSLCFIGLALGQNIATILVLRGFLGLFGCVGTILVGGTFVSDIDDELTFCTTC